MSFSTFKPVACWTPPVSGGNESHSKLSKVKMANRRRPSLQVKEKEKPLLQESFSATSRREMMHFTAASVGLLPFLMPAPTEARTRNGALRQKIFEKLEELRQKAGLSEPKDEGQEKKPEDEVQDKKPKLKNETEENKPELKGGAEEEPSLPVLPNIINGKSAETIFP